MSLDSFKELALTRRKRAESYALIEFYVPADFRCLADNDACSVVDEEVFADGRARVDVDTGLRVGILRHDTRDERHLSQIEFMSDSIDEDCVESRIGGDDCLLAQGRRVAVVAGLNVGHEHSLDPWELRREFVADALRFFSDLGIMMVRLFIVTESGG